MARLPREKSEIGIYHVMLRGINKQIIFEDNGDRDKFLTTLGSFKGEDNYDIYAYCLMDNHVHILIKEKNDNISTAIKRICSSYVYWYNSKYERCGHLFQERFKSEVVNSNGYLLTVLRYIHQNPIKAGIASTISEYKWSSYNEYISEPNLVNTDFVLNLFCPNRKKAKDLFIDFNSENNYDKCMDYGDIIKLTDKEVKEYIAKLGIKNIGELQNLNRDK
ncbi:transposase, partial [Clostridium sp. Cult2]|uniref:transposase n=1 Tax=Clostridium sp. Cult2 TaxID=2079003 RepID=UPI001F267335